MIFPRAAFQRDDKMNVYGGTVAFLHQGLNLYKILFVPNKTPNSELLHWHLNFLYCRDTTLFTPDSQHYEMNFNCFLIETDSVRQPLLSASVSLQLPNGLNSKRHNFYRARNTESITVSIKQTTL